MDIQEAYDRGFCDGLATYGWMKDGITWVGTCGTKLVTAVAKYRDMWNYSPPEEGE